MREALQRLKKLIQEIVDRCENVAEIDHYRELEEVEATTMLTAQRACTALDEQRMALLDRYKFPDRRGLRARRSIGR